MHSNNHTKFGCRQSNGNALGNEQAVRDVNLNGLLTNSFVKCTGGINDKCENLSPDNWKNYGQIIDIEVSEKDVFERKDANKVSGQRIVMV